MLIPFIKMQAQGNDFVILDLFEQKMAEMDYPRLAIDICKPHFGVAADGLVLLFPHPGADARMTIYNNDGSLAEMCGSALRCVSALMMQKTGRDELNILTDSGLKQAKKEKDAIVVNLGKAKLLRKSFPVEQFRGDLVDIGNPHYVVFVDSLDDDPHLKYGSVLEHHPAFEKPVNAHFVKVLEPGRIQMKIWEHACGATLACGTGAASSVYAGIRRGLLDAHVQVDVPGGDLHIVLQADESLLLSGTVAESFRGIYPWKTSASI
ncbi:MAG: diaminopimelate epimerase [Candidatus Cloacimonetes bacterium]|jgi:diaminopimelate epimerase|nr:diaminopimelate epimerase [Candidatus Cloacimonadota bacterium]